MHNEQLNLGSLGILPYWRDPGGSHFLLFFAGACVLSTAIIVTNVALTWFRPETNVIHRDQPAILRVPEGLRPTGAQSRCEVCRSAELVTRHQPELITNVVLS
jgi:hypothetical protein